MASTRYLRSQSLSMASAPSASRSTVPNVAMYRELEPNTWPKLKRAQARHIPIVKCPPRTFTHGEKLPPAVYHISKPISSPQNRKPIHQPLTNLFKVLSSPTPLIFSWSALAASNPPINFPNTMSWIEGSSQEWIGCDRRTGRVCLDADPFRATASEPQTGPHSHDDSSDGTTQWTFHGYSAGSEPFRSFLEAGLVPLDRDPDIIWGKTNNRLTSSKNTGVDDIYRAWRISTAGVADEVVPDLVVLGGGGSGTTMTIWDYEAAVVRYRGDATASRAEDNARQMDSAELHRHATPTPSPPTTADYNALPALPDRERRLRAIDTFNRNAAATFAHPAY
ncbi:MAG: hypothetical protein Q9173_005267, partial [Seirophora scorigena]